MQYATSALDEPGNYFSAHNAVKCEPVFQTIRYSGFCLAASDNFSPKLQDNRKPGFGQNLEQKAWVWDEIWNGKPGFGGSSYPPT